MNEVVLCYMLRYGKKPPNYRKSYDGVTTVGSNKPWEVSIREAQSFDPECRGQYSAAEIPMTLTAGREPSEGEEGDRRRHPHWLHDVGHGVW